MRLFDIRKQAPNVWKCAKRLVTYPELISDQKSNAPLERLEDQYSYLVNTLLIHDYIKHPQDECQPLTVFRVWGDFMNMQGLNQFFSNTTQLTEEAIEKANLCIDLIISIILQEFKKFNFRNTTIKLFREGGDEIGGFFIVHAVLTKHDLSLIAQNIKMTTDRINQRVEQLMLTLNLAFIDYVKNPTHPSRVGCGFIMKSIKVNDPQDSLNQIRLEEMVKKEKESVGIKRRIQMKKEQIMPVTKEEVYLKLQHLSALTGEDRRPCMLSPLINEIARCSFRFPDFFYYNDIIKADFTSFVLENLKKTAISLTILAIRFSNLRGMNDEYGHVASDYYVLKLVEAIQDHCMSKRLPIHIAQLSLLGMKVNNTVGLFFDSSQIMASHLAEEIKHIAEALCEALKLKNLHNYNDHQPNGLPIITHIENLSTCYPNHPQDIHHLFVELYLALSASSFFTGVLDKTNVTCPLQIKFPRQLSPANDAVYEPEEPVWLHKDSLHFKPILLDYLKTSMVYLVGNLLTASSNYVSNLIFIKSATDTQLALTAINLMYAEQSLLVNPAMGIASGTGVLIGEIDVKHHALDLIGDIFRHAMILNLLACMPCVIIMLLSKQILVAMNEPSQAVSEVEKYFQSYILSLIFQVLMRIQQQTLLSTDSIKIGLIQQGSQTLLTVGCSYLFIDILKSDVKGLGYAMTVTTCVNAILFALYLKHSKKYQPYQLFKMQLNDSKNIIKKLIRIGLPYSGQIFVEQAGLLCAAIMAGWLGEGASGAMQMTSRYVFPMSILGFSMGQSLSILIGRANGVGNFVKAKQLSLAALGTSSLLLLPLSFLFCTSPSILAKPFIDVSDPKNKDVLSNLSLLMLAQALVMPLDVSRNILEGALRGTGNSLFSFFCNLFSLSSFIGLGYVFSFKTNMGVSGFCFARLIGLIIINFLLVRELMSRFHAAMESGYYPVSEPAIMDELIKPML